MFSEILGYLLYFYVNALVLINSMSQEESSTTSTPKGPKPLLPVKSNPAPSSPQPSKSLVKVPPVNQYKKKESRQYEFDEEDPIYSDGEIPEEEFVQFHFQVDNPDYEMINKIDHSFANDKNIMSGIYGYVDKHHVSKGIRGFITLDSSRALSDLAVEYPLISSFRPHNPCHLAYHSVIAIKSMPKTHSFGFYADWKPYHPNEKENKITSPYD